MLTRLVDRWTKAISAIPGAKRGWSHAYAAGNGGYR
jgi:hypothetical protein